MSKSASKMNFIEFARGFTMIELLVSLSIIFVLTGTFLANYHYGTQKGNLNMAAQKLASDISLVRGYALGLKEFNGAFPAGGWGIKFVQNQDYYSIFGDLSVPDGYFSDNSELYSDIKIMQQNIEIVGRAELLCAGTTRTRVYSFLVFEPPEPIIHINGSNSLPGLHPQSLECEEMIVILTVKGTTQEKK